MRQKRTATKTTSEMIDGDGDGKRERPTLSDSQPRRWLLSALNDTSEEAQVSSARRSTRISSAGQPVDETEGGTAQQRATSAPSRGGNARASERASGASSGPHRRPAGKCWRRENAAGRQQPRGALSSASSSEVSRGERGRRDKPCGEEILQNYPWPAVLEVSHL